MSRKELDEFIIENYKKMRVKEMAAETGKSPGTIYMRAKRMKVRKNAPKGMGIRFHAKKKEKPLIAVIPPKRDSSWQVAEVWPPFTDQNYYSYGLTSNK